MGNSRSHCPAVLESCKGDRIDGFRKKGFKKARFHEGPGPRGVRQQRWRREGALTPARTTSTSCSQEMAFCPSHPPLVSLGLCSARRPAPEVGEILECWSTSNSTSPSKVETASGAEGEERLS